MWVRGDTENGLHEGTPHGSQAHLISTFYSWFNLIFPPTTQVVLNVYTVHDILQDQYPVMVPKVAFSVYI